MNCLIKLRKKEKGNPLKRNYFKVRRSKNKRCSKGKYKKASENQHIDQIKANGMEVKEKKEKYTV